MKKSVVILIVISLFFVSSVHAAITENVLAQLTNLPLFYEKNAFAIDIIIAALLFFSLGHKVFKQQRGIAIAVGLALTAGFIGIQMRYNFTFGSIYLLVIVVAILVVLGKVFKSSKGITANKWTILSIAYIIGFLLLKTKVPSFAAFIEDKAQWLWSVLWALWFIAITYMIFHIGGFFHGEKGLANIGPKVNAATGGFGNFLGKVLGYAIAGPFMLAFGIIKLPFKIVKGVVKGTFSLLGKLPFVGRPFRWLAGKFGGGHGNDAAAAAAKAMQQMQAAGMSQQQINEAIARQLGGH